jgi:glutathione synthase/RimK-type ligase-like ATP-grasp enzyme
MSRVALVTAVRACALDEDMPPLVDALAALDIAADVVTWDDPAVDWGRYALAVVRSTWDYVPRRDEFVAWADRVASATRLANPAPILRWNTDKLYLRELGSAGLAIVPTRWIAPTERPALRSDGDFVVKPSISAGARDTLRYSPSQMQAAVAHINDLQAQGRTVMVQPYLHRVDDAGETGLVFFGGSFSHAIRKGPILRGGGKLVEGLYVQEDIRGCEPTPAERRLAEQILAAVPGGRDSLLYARVDLAPGPDGRPMLLELEVTEPSVFLATAPGSADRFARAISRLV